MLISGGGDQQPVSCAQVNQPVCALEPRTRQRSTVLLQMSLVPTSLESVCLWTTSHTPRSILKKCGLFVLLPILTTRNMSIRRIANTCVKTNFESTS